MYGAAPSGWGQAGRRVFGPREVRARTARSGSEQAAPSAASIQIASKSLVRHTSGGYPGRMKKAECRMQKMAVAAEVRTRLNWAFSRPRNMVCRAAFRRLERGAQEVTPDAKTPCLRGFCGVGPVWVRCGSGVDPRLISESPVFTDLPSLFLCVFGTYGLGGAQKLPRCFAAGGSRRTGDTAGGCCGVQADRLTRGSPAHGGVLDRVSHIKSLQALRADAMLRRVTFCARRCRGTSPGGCRSASGWRPAHSRPGDEAGPG